MRLKLAALLALVVVASGCIGSSQTSEQKIESLTSKADSSTYHITYDISMGGNASNIFSQMIGSPELYSYKGDTKLVTRMSLLGSATLEVYENDGTRVSCSESTFGRSGINCRETDSGMVPTSKIADDAYDYSINRTGERTIAGRKCAGFRMRVANSSVDYAEEGKVLDICIDVDKGYLASMSMNLTQNTSITRPGAKLKMQVTSYDRDVSRQEVEIPVNAITSLSCEPFQAKITSLGYSGEARLEIAGENQTINLEEGEKTTVNLNSSKKTAFTNNIVLYTGEDKTSASCFSSDTGSLFE